MGRITQPTLFVWGRKNPFGDVPEAHRMTEAIPGSQLDSFPEGGNWPQHEHAATFNDRALAFLS